MNDINISYEDSLRLSELNGTLESLKYQADHILATHAPDFVLVIVLSIIFTTLIGLYMLSFTDDKPIKTRFDNIQDADARKTMLYTYRKIDAGNINTKVIEVKWVLKTWASALIIGLPILLLIILPIMTYISFASSVEMQMIDVQTQIDTILSIRGGVIQ